MKLLLIVNTSASSVTPRARVVIHRALSAEHSVTVKETNRRGHAARLAQGAEADGTDVVVVLGGDGTLNEAANGLAGTSVALAVLPGGSTNVFARTIGMPNEPIEATKELLAALESWAPERVGLGRANGRYFLFHAGFGFDAAVVSKVEKMAVLKRYTGPLVFVVAALATWAGAYQRRHPHFDVTAGTEGPFGSFFTLCLNTDPYTYFGPRPLHVAPGTTLAGPMTLVSFARLSTRSLVPALVRALQGHRPVDSPPSILSTDNVTVAILRARGAPFPFQLDGDYLGVTQQVELSWHPDVLWLVRPPR